MQSKLMKYLFSKIIYLYSFTCYCISVSAVCIFIFNFFSGLLSYSKTGNFYHYRASDYWGYTSESIIGFDNIINWILDINLLILSPIILIISIIINPRIDLMYQKEKDE